MTPWRFLGLLLFLRKCLDICNHFFEHLMATFEIDHRYHFSLRIPVVRGIQFNKFVKLGMVINRDDKMHCGSCYFFMCHQDSALIELSLHISKSVVRAP